MFSLNLSRSRLAQAALMVRRIAQVSAVDLALKIVLEFATIPLLAENLPRQLTARAFVVVRPCPIVPEFAMEPVSRTVPESVTIQLAEASQAKSPTAKAFVVDLLFPTALEFAVETP